jgi:hypothetical protein
MILSVAGFLSLLITLLIVALMFAVIVWVLGLFGIAVPQRILQIVGAIIVLMLLLAWLGGGLPVYLKT